jgi:CBS domain-containing protein
MDLKEELRAEQVRHLNLSKFCLVPLGTSVQDTVALMRQKGVSVCLIADGEKLAGILTDRDVLRRVAPHPNVWQRPIQEVMTADPVTISPDMSAAEAVWLMDERHVRDLPAVDSSGRIAGNMTHQSVITFLAGRYPTEILNLPPEPGQFPDQVEGG